MAHANRARLIRLPLAGGWALAPAGIVLGLLVVASLGYVVAQSLGLAPLTGEATLTVDAYRRVLGDDELPSSLGLTLWVAGASTALAIVLSLIALVWLDRPVMRRRRVATGVMHAGLALPHAVWAVALLLLLAQTGILARVADAIGLIEESARFPVVVTDRLGIGLIIHYATKEAPFLALIGLALSRSQPPELRIVAETLGATGWRRARLVTLPVILPGVLAAAALVFVFVVGAYEAPVLLGVSSPRILGVLGIDLFNDSDLTRRPEAMALVTMTTLTVLAMVAAIAALVWRRRA